MKISRTALIKAAAVAGVALAALGTASVAQARSNVYFSVGVPLAPGVSLGVSNAPYYGHSYYPQTYYAPPPVYVAPQPIYYQPAPVYYAPPVYGVTYVRPSGHRHHYNRHQHHGHRNWR